MNFHIGTHHFLSEAAATTYYRRQDPDHRPKDTRDKLEEGLIALGPPKPRADERVYQGEDGRYFLEVYTGGRVPVADEATKAVQEGVQDVLRGLIWKDGACQISKQLERQLFVQVNEALLYCGGEWSRKNKAYVFDIDGEDRVREVIATGVYVSRQSERKQFQHFPTPDAVGIKMLKAVGLKKRADHSKVRMLEPSAGDGHLAKLARSYGVQNIVCVELHPERADALAADGFEAYVGDFMQMTVEPNYTHVLINPPFTAGQDIEHVRRAFDWMVPGGRMAAIVSAGVQFRSDRRTQDFRRFIDDYGYIVEELEPGAFKESGTYVASLLLSLKKST